MVPNDPETPTRTSGIRLGSAAGTTRGFGTAEFTQIGLWIAEVLKAEQAGNTAAVALKIRTEVAALCAKFPIYPA